MNINHKNIYYQSKKEIKDMIVKKEIEKIFENNPSYGHQRLSLALKINRKKILRIMKKYQLKPPRLWYQKKFTTQSNPVLYTQCENLLKNSKLTTNGINIGDIWSSDLTYIKYQNKFFYLAIIQDVASKEIVGFNLSNHHNSNLVLKTLKEAIENTNLKYFTQIELENFYQKTLLNFLKA